MSRDFKRTSKYNSIQMSRTLAYLRCSKNLRDTCNRLYMSIAFYCSITKEMIHLPFISNAITHLLHIYHTKVMSGENKVLLSFNQAFIILPVIVIIRSIFFHNRLKRGSISIQVKPELNRQSIGSFLIGLPYYYLKQFIRLEVRYGLTTFAINEA